MRIDQEVLGTWIPKSEKGREVARYMRDEGFDVRDREVVGHYLVNVYGADELSHDQLMEIGIILAGSNWEMAERYAYA